MDTSSSNESAPSPVLTSTKQPASPWRRLSWVPLALAGMCILLTVGIGLVWQAQRSNLQANLADLVRRGGRPDAALTHLDRALEADPHHPGLRLVRCQALFDQQRYTFAIPDCELALVGEEPEMRAQAHLYLGHNQYELKDYDRALVDYTAAIEIQPDLAEAVYWRGQTYNRLGEKRLAIEDLDRAVRRLGISTAEAYNSLGWIWIEWGEAAQAQGAFNEMLRRYSQDYRAYLGRGVASTNGGELEQALADFQKAFELEPDDVYLNYYRGLAYQQHGDREQAIRDLETFLAHNIDAWYRNQTRCHLQELYADQPFDSICKLDEDGW